MSTHEGFRNYPTWAVNLWIDNDEGLYREVREREKHLLHELGIEVAVGELAEWLEGWITEMMSDPRATTASCIRNDLLTYALAEVDWQEVAESQLGDDFEPSEESAS